MSVVGESIMQFFTYGRINSWNRKCAAVLGGALLALSLAGCSFESDEKTAQPDSAKPSEVIAAKTQALVGES